MSVDRCGVSADRFERAPEVRAAYTVLCEGCYFFIKRSIGISSIVLPHLDTLSTPPGQL